MVVMNTFNKERLEKEGMSSEDKREEQKSKGSKKKKKKGKKEAKPGQELKDMDLIIS